MARVQKKHLVNLLVGAVYLACLEVLAYIVNLNQLATYIKLCAVLYLYIILHITVLYDLHFKTKSLGSFADFLSQRNWRDLFHAIWQRLEHLRRWTHLRHWQNYLVLPAFIFWATVTLMYLNLGRVYIQQIYVFASAVALGFVYLHLTDIFKEKQERVSNNTFVTLSAIKLYTAFITFAASLGLTRHFCLPPHLFVTGIFVFTAFLIYQALFQHNLLNLKTLLFMLLIAAVLGAISYWVLLLWGLNYFTAGVFLMAIYNFLWSLLHHYLEKTLTVVDFLELVVVNLIVVLVALGVTNFKARLRDSC